MSRAVRSMFMDVVDRRALADNLYRVTIAANEAVRQPPALSFDGLSTANYFKNPVVMWAHDVTGRTPSGGLPVGRTIKLTATPEGRIVADFEFLSDDPFAGRVKNAWDKGFLRAASISWLPLETRPAEGGFRDVRSELLEWSIVPVPADPDALRRAHQRMMEDLLGDDVWPSERRQNPGSDRWLSPGYYEDMARVQKLLDDVLEWLTPATDGGRAEEVGDAGSKEDLEEISSLVKEIMATVNKKEVSL